MEVIYALIPMMLIFGFLVVIVFIWMAKSGQFDDMDGAANRIFMDDEYPEDIAPRKSAESASNAVQEDNQQASNEQGTGKVEERSNKDSNDFKR
ncbi:MAG: cbb3-type cytochrome oxidase assembly protein CcoS [Thiotrichales bacterium]|nr:cbb3-type cytochrome oxidase assembly protein CcoS [Thiotrichales bacterium]